MDQAEEMSRTIAHLFNSHEPDPDTGIPRFPPPEPPDIPMPVVPKEFLRWAEGADKVVREVVEELRARESLLIASADKLEEQEEQLSAEAYSAQCVLIRARTEEEMAEVALKHSEAVATEAAEALLVREGRISKDTKLPKVTDVRTQVGLNPTLKLAREELLRAKEKRKLAEAYFNALQLKFTILPGMQGARNRHM